jgi:hypothetical protein
LIHGEAGTGKGIAPGPFPQAEFRRRIPLARQDPANWRDTPPQRLNPPRHFDLI